MANILRRPVKYRFFNATIILIVVNVLIYLLSLVNRTLVDGYLSLVPAEVFVYGWWWQVVTYMFVHYSFFHILFNMLALFLFGIQLEQRMGSTEFLVYYFVSGIGAGLATLFINVATGQAMVATGGASGAIYALLLAFAAYFPDARIFIFGILPMRAPVAVAVFAVIDIVSEFVARGAGIAYLTHLSGLVFGYLYLMVRLGMNPIAIFLRKR